MKNYDLIVVGAGPAGATAARVAARQGLKTLLLEKYPLPREKRCGGGISAGALQELDFDLPEEVVERRCYGMRAVQGRLIQEVVSPTVLATMVTRAKFDAFLTEQAQAAGAEVHPAEPCLKLQVGPEGVLVETGRDQYRAELVIGADGVNSIVAPLVRPRFRPGELRLCIIAEAPLAEAVITERSHNLVELHYGYIDLGYAWIFPKKDYLSCGIGGAYTQSKLLQPGFEQFLKLQQIKNATKLKGCLIPISDFRSNCYANRLLLVGDAAGFVDSFSGEGVRWALASGRMAAETALQAHRVRDFSPASLRQYQDRFYAAHKEDLRASSRFNRLAFQFPKLFLGTLMLNEAVIRRYFLVMAGTLQFREFAGWVATQLPGMLARRLTGKGRRQ